MPSHWSAPTATAAREGTKRESIQPKRTDASQSNKTAPKAANGRQWRAAFRSGRARNASTAMARLGLPRLDEVFHSRTAFSDRPIAPMTSIAAMTSPAGRAGGPRSLDSRARRRTRTSRQSPGSARAAANPSRTPVNRDGSAAGRTIADTRCNGVKSKTRPSSTRLGETSAMLRVAANVTGIAVDHAMQTYLSSSSMPTNKTSRGSQPAC